MPGWLQMSVFFHMSTFTYYYHHYHRTFLKHVLSIVLLILLLQEVVSDVELEVSKMDVLRLLPPGATGVYTLC